MSLTSEINRIETAKADIAAAITEKGVTVPNTTKIDGMAALISNITAGGGGKQVAMGTFTTSLVRGVSTEVIKIEGLGIKPSTVAVFRTAGSTMGANKSQAQIQAVFYVNGESHAHYTYQSTTSGAYASVGRDKNGTYAKIELTNDGFRVLTGTGSTYENRFVAGTYQYIAIE